MKKHLLSILAVFSITAMVGQSVPNGGFESWTISNYENPAGFQTSNYKDDHDVIGTQNAVKTTDAYHGNYAIKLTTVVTGTAVNFAFFANGDPGKNPVSGGVPYNQKPSGIRFHYKCNVMPGDSAIFLAFFKKNNVTIGSYFFKITGTQSAYTLYNANLSPALPMNPDSVVIAACSSNAFA
jgi:hypothetical protein